MNFSISEFCRRTSTIRFPGRCLYILIYSTSLLGLVSHVHATTLNIEPKSNFNLSGGGLVNPNRKNGMAMAYRFSQPQLYMTISGPSMPDKVILHVGDFSGRCVHQILDTNEHVITSSVLNFSYRGPWWSKKSGLQYTSISVDSPEASIDKDGILWRPVTKQQSIDAIGDRWKDPKNWENDGTTSSGAPRWMLTPEHTTVHSELLCSAIVGAPSLDVDYTSQLDSDSLNIADFWNKYFVDGALLVRQSLVVVRTDGWNGSIVTSIAPDATGNTSGAKLIFPVFNNSVESLPLSGGGGGQADLVITSESENTPQLQTFNLRLGRKELSDNNWSGIVATIPPANVTGTLFVNSSVDSSTCQAVNNALTYDARGDDHILDTVNQIPVTEQGVTVKVYSTGRGGIEHQRMYRHYEFHIPAIIGSECG
ncbi:hypothetical protein [Escherichia coli]|uniref:hypothetical protein n=1 Tax=Escherichia coli TaxID=562 RepID=UPI0038B3799F